MGHFCLPVLIETAHFELLAEADNLVVVVKFESRERLGFGFG